MVRINSQKSFSFIIQGSAKKKEEESHYRFVASTGMKMDLPNTATAFEERERDGSPITWGSSVLGPRTKTPNAQIALYVYICMQVKHVI